MAATAGRARDGADAAILSYGFRPFFLGASLWAALSMALWVAIQVGGLPSPASLAPADWHVHSLLYGYLPAVMAGFLLTAVPGWTGRPPLTGWPLLGLVLLWLAGRAAVTSPWALPPVAVAVLDVGFLAAVLAVAGREIAAGRSWRNLAVLAVIALLGCSNAIFHVEATSGVAARGLGARIGIAAAIFLILLVGGRIVPTFTRNWLAVRGPGAQPAPMSRLDEAALGVAALALATWIVAPEARASGAACLVAGLAHLARLARWAGWRTRREPLVAILHVGYLFAPLGLLTVGASILAPGLMAPAAALHRWTAGAVGVMTRASLGHTGRPLAATPAIGTIYVAAIGAALLRLAEGLAPGQAALLHGSATLWILAFASFALAFAGPLMRSCPAAG